MAFTLADLFLRLGDIETLMSSTADNSVSTLRAAEATQEALEDMQVRVGRLEVHLQQITDEIVTTEDIPTDAN